MQKLYELTRNFNKYDAKYKIVSTFHIQELKKEIEYLYGSGKINQNIYKDYLKEFHFKVPENFNDAQSIIIIAIQQRISLVTFQLDNKKIKIIIPPTYIYRKIREQCKDILSEVFGNNIKISRALLPLKLLAVHSGLGRYGKNNLCYIDGMGSFARLEAFYIEYKCDRDEWQNTELLQECRVCNRCVNYCPTKCISDDEFVINAGKCLTYFNEAEKDFPEYIDKNMHNALVGCIKCQSVCPVNHPYLKVKSVVESFDKEETFLIMNSNLKESKSLTSRLKQLDMDEYQYILGRNLKALIKG